MGITTDDLPEQVVDAAYEHASRILRDAVHISANKEQFLHNLAHCQIMSSRVLALLTFNAYESAKTQGRLNGKCIWDFFNKSVDALRKELAFVLTQHEAGGTEEVKFEAEKQEKGVLN